MIKLWDPITKTAQTELEWFEEGKGEEVRNEFIQVEHFTPETKENN